MSPNLMMCAYCGAYVPDTEDMFTQRLSLDMGNFKFYTGIHPGCAYDWDNPKQLEETKTAPLPVSSKDRP